MNSACSRSWRRVDALDFIRVADLVALDPQPRADELVHAIRQLILAVLGRRQLLQRGKDRRRGDDVGAHVQLVDFAHGGRRFRLFDDIHDAPPGIANDAAVGQGPVRDRRQQRQVRLPQRMPVQQPANGSGPEQRGVAVEDQQVALVIFEGGGQLLHRVPGAQRLGLDDVVALVCPVGRAPRPADRRPRRIDVVGNDLPRVGQDILQDRAVAQRCSTIGRSPVAAFSPPARITAFNSSFGCDSSFLMTAPAYHVRPVCGACRHRG